jgi:hypothetical protein
VLLKGTEFVRGYKCAFATLFGQDVQNFTDTMILNLDQLQQQLDQGIPSKTGSLAALSVLNKQLQMFFDSKLTLQYDYYSDMTRSCFAKHTSIEVDTFRNTLIQLMDNVKTFIMERAQLSHLDDETVKGTLVQSCDGIDDAGKALDDGLSVEMSKESANDMIDNTTSSVTSVINAESRNINDQRSSAEVPLIDQHNVLSNEREHSDQIKLNYDANLLEKTDNNIMSNSTNMSHKGGDGDHDAVRDKVLSSMSTADVFKSKDMVDKETFDELLKRFLQLEKHCISLEIAMQQKEESFQYNQPCKNQELPDVLEYFMINDLKTQLETKNLIIKNLKSRY